jgi:hypothetical protein
MLKKVLFIGFMVFCKCSLGFADDNATLQEILNTYQYKFIRNSPFGGINEFPDIEIKLLTYSEIISPPALLGAFYNNELIALFGVMYGNPPGIYYMYDFNGDGVFEYRANQQFFIPPWIVYKMNISRNRPNEFINICSDLYNMYNSNEGVDNQKLTEILNNIIVKIKNTAEANRDIYYSLFQYFQFYNQYPEIALNIMLALGDHMIYETDEMIPLILLYSGEASFKSGNIEKSLLYFNGLKSIDRNSIVADYYIALLNDRKNNTIHNMNEFKNKYQIFWMIK